MDANLKKALRAISLELRHTLEGTYDERGDFQPGDLERRLNAIGVWRNRPSKLLAELTHLPDEDKAARQVIDAYLGFRAEAGVAQAEAVAEFVREAAYNWANRLLTLRCMEARGIIDEVILQKEVYGRRSMVHNRLGQRDPALLAQPDEGLFTVLLEEFGQRARELPTLFNPKAPAIALRPSLAALKKCIGLLSGTVKAGNYEAAGDELFAAPDALGWAYQYWNAEEKDRVFEKVRTEKGAKIAGADIIPATQLYTEPYMVKFLVQNSLGALWLGMHPDSHLAEGWEYYVRDADRAPVEKKPVRDITFLDPACGSGHFHLEAFDLLYAMYEAEAAHSPEEICAAILNHNLYGIDIDERAIQIAQAALWMKAKEVAWDLEPEALTGFHHHFVSTNIKLPQGINHLEAFLRKHPEDLPLRPALETVFEGLENAHELGSLLQLEEPVEKELRYLQGKQAEVAQTLQQGELFAELAKPRQGALPLGVESYDAWKAKTLTQLRVHFEAEAEAADLTQAFFGQSAGKGLDLFNILSKEYDAIAANPPYLSQRNMSASTKAYLVSNYPFGASDLYTCFMECFENHLPEQGRLAFVTSHTFMFIGTYELLRQKFLLNGHFEPLCHYGTGIMKDVSNPNALGFCSWVFFKQHSTENSSFLDLRDSDDRANALCYNTQKLTIINNKSILSVPEYRLAYWMPESIINLFGKWSIGNLATLANRTKTGDNSRFVRYFWEIQKQLGGDTGWLLYQMGGEYRTYFGNNQTVIRWDDARVDHYRNDPSCRVTDAAYTCKIGITYNAQGQQLCARLVPPISTYDVSGPTILFDDEDDLYLILALMNSPFASYVVKSLNATVNIQSSEVLNIPIPNFSQSERQEIVLLSQHLYEISYTISSRVIVEYNFEKPDYYFVQAKEFINGKEKLAKIIQSCLRIDNLSSDDLFTLPSETSIETEDSIGYRSNEDWITWQVLLLLGHRWPTQIEAREPVPAWAEPSGIIPIINSSPNQPTLYDRVRDRLTIDFPDGNPSSIEREFADIVGEKLADWLAGSFFSRHISQFKKRPIAWQLQTSAAPGQRQRGGPAFAALLYYHKLSADLLPTLRNQTIRDLIRAYETEQRTLRQSQERSSEQETRLHQLETWLTELQTFSDALQFVSDHGFGDTSALQATLRQYALDDAMQSLKATWLRRLADKATTDALSDWQTRADKTGIHPALRDWIAAATANLAHHCAQVGAPAPKATKLKTDPDARALAVIIGTQAKEMVAHSLKLAGDAWFSELDTHVLRPLLDEINDLKAQQAALETERETLAAQDTRALYENEQAIKSLKATIRKKNKTRSDYRKAANELREHIESWRCPAAATWTDWLGQQPLFDAFASLDGQRQPPQTIAEFVMQESRYAPDINDGVRVNIAPLQKAGLLAADVLAAKDVDKAIADRADWRADERRWCREGKLPRPGWWP